MSETKSTAGQPLDPGQVSDVSGGLTCSPDDIREIISGLRDNYDRLVEFTSYVMDRVGGNSSPGP